MTTKYALHVGLQTDDTQQGQEELEAILDDVPDVTNVYVEGDSFIEWGEKVDYTNRSNERLHAVIEYEAPSCPAGMDYNHYVVAVGMYIFRELLLWPDFPISLTANCAIFREKHHNPFAISLMEDWSVQYGAG